MTGVLVLEPYCDISFSEKVRIYSRDYLKCCVYISGLDSPDHIFTKKLYSTLISTSHLLEDFLDFHGAKNNKNWFLYREFASAVRHLSLAGYAQRHIMNRLAFYELPEQRDFLNDADKTIDFITKTLMKLSPQIIDEAKRLNIEIPDAGYDLADFPGVITSEVLEYDIDDEDYEEQKQNIVKISSEFLSIVKRFETFGFYEPVDLAEITNMVPAKVNEVEIRRFEMLVHNLQSSFDSYVIQGGYRFGNRKLKRLRGSFSIVFHLLQITGRLLHFYERHLHGVECKNAYRQVRERLSEIIVPEEILDRTVNYGLFYACHFLTSGKSVAKDILNENIERSSITVGIPVSRGFHSRPSLMVAKIVQHFGGKVELCISGDRFDASSVLDIQWAGGKIQKENITQVTFEGDTRALHDIEILASVNYGEDSMGKGIPLPRELAYLR